MMRVVFAICLATPVAMPGCAASSGAKPVSAAPQASDGLTQTMPGKPRDLWAAVARSTAEVGLTILERTHPEGQENIEIYSLVGARGETGQLRIEMPDNDRSAPDWRRISVSLKVTLAIGRFGDAAREARMMSSFKRELMALARDQ